MPDSPPVKIPGYFQEPRTLPIAEWLPDQPALSNPGCTVARNVIPRSQASYGPLQSLASFGYGALPSQPFGLYNFLDQTNNIHLFTGTANKLYQLVTGGNGFQDVSAPNTTYSTSIDNPWFMTSFGNTIVATNGADQPQSFVIGTSTTFANLGGVPPIAHYVATVRDFLFLGNCIEGGNIFPQRVHWSAIANINLWPQQGSQVAEEEQSDSQDLRSDLGQVRGIVSGLQGADAAIFMDQGVYYVNYVGSPAVFSFFLSPGVPGCRYPNSIVTHHGIAYFLTDDGFWSFNGGQGQHIGGQKIDDWFFGDPADGANRSFLDRCIGGATPDGHLIFWLYCGPGSTGTPNRAIIYNWQIARWSMARIDALWLGRALTLGFSLDQLDAFGNLETLPFSLDSAAWQGGAPLLLSFDTKFNLSAFQGPNLAATVETAEQQLTPGRRSRVTSTRPLVDGVTPVPSVALGYRNRQHDVVTYNDPVVANINGECIQGPIDNRYFRAQINIPAGSFWTHVTGCDVMFRGSTPR